MKALQQKSLPKTSSIKKEPKSAYDKVKETETEELVIALCGPIGTDLHSIAESLEHLLNNSYGYDCKRITLSHIIRTYGDNDEFNNEYKAELDRIKSKSENFKKIKNAILQGNFLRNKYDSSILSELAIQQIAMERTEEKEKNENKAYKSRRVCYIIDSLKNKEELEILRLVYRELFYFVGVFSPLNIRLKNLHDKQIPQTEIDELIDQDSGEEIPYGQAVTDTFQLADFFLRIDSETPEYTESKISRFLNLVFGIKIITPTNDETAMYHAASAATNSACLSRQVGAAITDSKGEIISVGWNDVPKYGGNLYMYSHNDPLGKLDKRCMNTKKGCHNEFHKNLISEELVKSLIDKELINNSKRELASEIIKKSKIKNLMEFSRAIHAEMHAMIIGSQLSGSKMIDGKLYCTTYPCHNCARHLIVAGIKEIYFIEPYRKSLCIDLHYDSFTEDENEKNKVRILMFDGVAPNKYIQFFKMTSDSRKINITNAKSIKLKKTKPKISLSLEALTTLESLATKSLAEKGIQLK